MANPLVTSGLSNQQLVNTSLSSTVANGIEFGYPATFDAYKQALTFMPANISGICLRIGANGSSLGTLANWPSIGTATLTIAHNLGAIPYGFLVIAKSGPCDVYWNVSTYPPTSTNITLTTTDGSVDTTIIVLA